MTGISASRIASITGRRLRPPSSFTEWAPSWLPTIDDERRARRLGWVIGAVLLAGLAGCVGKGGDQPADPVLEGGPATSAPATDPSGEPAPAPTSPPPDGGGEQGAGSLAARFGTVLARLVDASGEVLELCLLHADTAEERAQGLMQVTDLEGHDGMLFSVDEPTSGAFYMYRTVTPLTIGWFDAAGAFVSRADMAPCPSEDPDACDRYPPAGPWTSAIEVVQGDPLAARFQPGATLTPTDGACPA